MIINNNTIPFVIFTVYHKAAKWDGGDWRDGGFGEPAGWGEMIYTPTLTHSQLRLYPGTHLSFLGLISVLQAAKHPRGAGGPGDLQGRQPLRRGAAGGRRADAVRPVEEGWAAAQDPARCGPAHCVRALVLSRYQNSPEFNTDACLNISIPILKRYHGKNLKHQEK